MTKFILQEQLFAFFLPAIIIYEVEQIMGRVFMLFILCKNAIHSIILLAANALNGFYKAFFFIL